MTTFQDANSREWNISLDLDTVERIQQETNVSVYLLLADECKPLAELLGNLPVLAHVCYIACDAEAQGVERKAYCKAMKGDALKRMTDAFLEELKLFFPDPRRREAVGKLIDAANSFEEQALSKLEKEMAQVNPEKWAENEITRMLRRKPGNSSDGSDTPESNRGS